MAAEGDAGLRRLSGAAPIPGTALAAVAAGAVAGLLLYVGLEKVGPAGVIAPAFLVAGLILLRMPGLTTAILLAGVILFEPTDPGLLPTFNAFYTVIRASLTPVEVLLFMAVAGVLIEFAIEGRRPRLPDPLVPALSLFALAALAGVITGYLSPVGVSAGDLYHRGMNAVYIILVPLLLVNTLRGPRGLKLFLGVAAGLGAFKGLSGAYSALSGTGSQLTEETISYLEPVPNLVMMALVLGAVAALVRGVKLPAWVYAAAPLAALALLLSYRRSFWIAAIFALIVVVIAASRHRGKAVLLIGAVALGLTFAAVLTVGSSGPEASPLLKRAQELSPTGIEANRGDRYRNDERHNVIANLEEHPLTGTGLGVGWKAKYPLSESHDQTYVHLAVLWFWLAYGPLGPIAYLFLMGTGIWASSRIWSRHPDPLVQVGALAVCGMIVVIMVVELTATFTAIEPRFSIVVGALLGWLAAAWRSTPKAKASTSLAA